MSKYWKQREQNHQLQNIKNDKRAMKRIKEKYMDTMDELNEQIESFYGRYAGVEGIAIAEARKRVKKADINKYKRKAKKYVKNKDFTQRANEEMRLYNVTMRVNRMELLKKEMQLELLKLSSEVEREMSTYFYESAIREYEHQSAVLGMSLNSNHKAIESIINSSFYSAEWSEVLWANQEALRHELDKLLHRGLVQGKHPKVLARELRKNIDSSIFNSERLLRTETARVQTDVFVDSAKQAGITKYVWLAESDACDECADLDGKVFEISKMQYGVDAVPKHPHCRCTLAMHFEE